MKRFITQPQWRLLRFALPLLLALTAVLAWSANRQHEATLEIRAVREGVSLPDGFFVWHHLDANGIAFKSITPHRDGLVIRCVTNVQCEAARDVLRRSLPQDYELALREDKSAGASLLARLRTSSHRMG
ncbi:modulator protein MzrA [Salmonella enterica subsp. enterica serovar Choleraesuis]|nr:modulator protein MzrA [Salmonella enterica subsp. enterica serovar Choleraesuis]